ncbi:LL-diaminopimelate aminotransferase [Tenuibacillus multivorans]|uniref:Aminotransferase n=1 Tax=Tenuibacillus multivorans TaxID=237069 RepID=A0A1H0DIA6_9BACI|nr:LL-diaminopimelate aminotransferase [Tenuibacillus multivorans]GEL76543.1 LL-diaminopimelate aminotransferase [Tenuibacillus multivorans]SDN69798.1 LL-diaminopimelate aminotransferase [Tenuibacillus multivorans]
MKFSSERVETLPPYVFSQFHKRKKELEAEGLDIIDLGIGSPDLPTPEFIVDELVQEVYHANNHRYSPYQGSAEFRQAVADFYRSNYEVDLDPETEVLTLIGSKEGIANLITAVVNPSETVLVPDPGYPVYQSAIHLAGGKTALLPLIPEEDYKPNYQSLPQDILDKTKLMLLNYPSNPTAGTVNIDAFLEAVSLAKKHDIAIAHDAAYGLVTFDDYEAPSILQAPDAKDVAVEFGSLSKSFNMTGWRIGYVVGNRDIIQALSVVKSNTDTSQFLPIQKAAAKALRSDFSTVNDNNAVYEQRQDKVLCALKELGIEVKRPRGTFFIWAKVPDGFKSMEFSELMLEKAGVIITPGSVFGPSGEGYFRISLSVPSERLEEAIKRMKVLEGGV